MKFELSGKLVRGNHPDVFDFDCFDYESLTKQVLTLAVCVCVCVWVWVCVCVFVSQLET